MEINPSNIIRVLSDTNNIGNTMQQILTLLEQPKSKKNRLRKVIREMSRKENILKGKNKYYIYKPLKKKNTVLGESKMGAHSKKQNHSGRKGKNSYQPSPAPKNTKPPKVTSHTGCIQGMLLPGVIPCAGLPESGDIVEIAVTRQLHDCFPWDVVELKRRGENELFAVERVIRRRFKSHQGISHTEKSGFMLPHGFPYLPIHGKVPGNKLHCTCYIDRDAIGTNTRNDRRTIVSNRQTPLHIAERRAELRAKHRLPSAFPPKVEKESRAFPTVVRHKSDQQREDLRHIPFVTVDGKNAKDFDDAIYAETLPTGYKLMVSIADVSHYIKPGSELDAEAETRGNSCYLIDEVIPMLPPVLSNTLCSLKPDVNRYTVTCEITMDFEGSVVNTRIFLSTIKSIARLTYEEIDVALASNQWPAKLSRKGIDRLMILYFNIADSIKKKREQRGMLGFSFPDYEFDMDDSGDVVAINEIYQSKAMGLIEQFMLEANEAVAEFAHRHKIPLFWRNHPPPDPQKIQRMGFLLRRYSINPSTLGNHQKLNATIEEIRQDETNADVMERTILRCMSNASYGVRNIGHFGLAAKKYCHFTSPIRRYADLLVHRNIKNFLNGTKTKKVAQVIAKHLSECEKTASEAERDIRKLYGAHYFGHKIGDTVQGMITDVGYRGIFVRIKSTGIEGIIEPNFLRQAGFKFFKHPYRYKNGAIEFCENEPVNVVITGINTEMPKPTLIPCLEITNRV